jgi:gliding motility-associated-like protein
MHQLYNLMKEDGVCQPVRLPLTRPPFPGFAHLVRYLTVLLWAFFPGFSLRAQTLPADTIHFAADTTIALRPLWGGQSAFADFNNDSRMDVLVTGLGKDSLPQIHLYLNRDSIDLVLTPTALPALKNASLALTDYNGDMFIDVLLSGTDAQGNRVNQLFANRGGAVFDEVPVALPVLQSGNVLWVDLNGDGQKDLFMNGLNEDGKPVSRVFQNKNGTFSEVSTPIQGLSHGAVVTLDDNQDGRTDLFINGLDSTYQRTALLYYSTGKFKFKRDSVALNDLRSQLYGSDNPVTDSLSRSGATVGDYNHDGRADLLITGKGNNGQAHSKLYLRQALRYVADTLTLTPIHSGTAYLADLDNDGRTDVFLSGPTESDTVIHQLYRNASSDSVQVVNLPLSATQGVHFALGDYTLDGNLDLLQTGLSATDTLVTRLYWNTTPRPNNGALPPIDADVMTLGDKAIFTWSRGSDDVTNASALTYDLYVSKEVGYPQMKASEANTGDYFRWVVAHGSQGQTGTFIIEGLPEGDFVWDIIAVDNAFQSGVHCYFDCPTGGGGGGGTPRSKRFRICDNVIKIDTTLCEKSNLVLRTDHPATWYSENKGLLLKDAKELTYQVTEGDTVFAITMVANRCTEEKRFTVHASKPAPFSLGNDVSVCPNEPFSLNVNGNWTGVKWYVKGKGMVQSAPMFNYSFGEATEVWAEVTDAYGCTAGDTIRVSLYDVPTAAGAQVSVTEGESVGLSVSGGVTYRWSPATTLSNPNSANPEASPEESTTYYVTITTANGCEVRDSVRVTVNKIPPDIFIPSLFTPNGDGKNDYFRVYGAAFRELALLVYDRSGNLLYETHDVKEALNAGWDGQANGSPQPNGSYVWIIKGTFRNGSEVKYKGKTSGIINLMR